MSDRHDKKRATMAANLEAQTGRTLAESGDSALRTAVLEEANDVFVSAAGAIGSPALLLRSRIPDPYAVAGVRTFLHPTVVSAALMPERVDGYAGAPQTIFSDHYVDTAPIDGPIGFKLEAPPVHPVLAAITLPGHGNQTSIGRERATNPFLQDLRQDV